MTIYNVMFFIPRRKTGFNRLSDKYYTICLTSKIKRKKRGKPVYCQIKEHVIM